MLFPCCKSTVLWTVIAIWVNAVYRKGLFISIENGPFTESIERGPFVAQADSSTAIVVKVFVLWVVATLSDSLPYPVQMSVGLSVDATRLYAVFFAKTAATASVATFKVSTCCDRFIPAIAQA